MSEIRAVLFDLDGTLVDREAAFHRIAERFYETQPGLRASTRREDVRETLVAWENDGDTDRRALFQKAKETWPEINGSVAELVDWYTQAMAVAVEPDERVLDLLERMSAARIPWGIITNGGQNQINKMRAARFEAITPFVILSEEFGSRKPDPRIFHEGLRRLGEVPAAQTLFVGDKPAIDVLGAQQVGMQTAWVRRGQVYPPELQPADYQIDHVQELAPYLGIG